MIDTFIPQKKKFWIIRINFLLNFYEINRICLGMGLATAQVEEVTVEVMVDRRSKLDSPEAVGILDLVAGIIVVEEAEGT